MAKRRKTVTRRKRRVYKNPTRRRRIAKSAASRVRSTLGGMNFKTALKNMIPIQLGMFATKWAVKRFSDEYSASLGDASSWNWTSYLKGVAGAVGAGMAMNMVKPGYGQKVFEGGINYLAFQLIQNKVVSPSEWATGQFGADDADYIPDEYMDGADVNYQPGDLESGPDGQPYLLGADLKWRPAEGGYAGMGDSLEPVGPLGDSLEPVGPLGNSLDQLYAERLLDN